MAVNPQADNSPQPRVWMLFGDKGGDNSQVTSIEKRLGWVCEHKYLHVREPYVLSKPKVTASLHHIDLSQSDSLEPPWPDLVITTGRRLSMVALWIRQQSGRRSKIVFIGKPSGMIEHFDLVIVSAEAQVPPLANVLPITLPLIQVNETALTDAIAKWEPRLANLPRPLIAMLIGGPTVPFAFNRAVITRLITLATEIVDDMGGTPYITTSPRTPQAIVEALKTGLPPGAQFFQWSSEASENPYHGLLGLADGFIVTGDSISMIVEVVRLGKPLAIFPLPTTWRKKAGLLRRSLTRWLFSPATETTRDHVRQRLARAVFRMGLLTSIRDFRAFYRLLMNRGLAVRCGYGFHKPQGQVPDDFPLVVARIKALIDR